MTRDEKIAEAHRLRAEGLSYRRVGVALGESYANVYRWLNPEWYRAQNAGRNAAKQEWAREHARAVCPCGALRGIGTRRESGEDGLCRECRDEVVRVGRAMRQERIAEMWARGLKQREIAHALGSTRASINVEMVRMRREGWELPQRHDWTEEGLARVRGPRRAEGAEA